MRKAKTIGELFLFLFLLLLIFYLTFNGIGKLLTDLLASGLASVTEALSHVLMRLGISPGLHSLIVDGICAGVGSVLSFVPTIAVLFFFLSMLEESGYLDSVAELADRPLRKLGLSGRCMIPLIMGFGCSVPAVMAAGATLPCERQRRATMALLPFISCSAKLPIYTMFTMVFFTERRAIVMVGIYATGIIIAILCALLLKFLPFASRKTPYDAPLKKKFCQKPSHRCCTGRNPGKLSRIPPSSSLSRCRLPNFTKVASAVWENSKAFVKKAFTVIFLASIIVWFLQAFDADLQFAAQGEDSLLATLGKWAAPLFAPLGFGDWRAASAVIAGFFAKEAVVSTLAVLSPAASGDTLSILLSEIFSPLSAFSFIIFCLLYAPCIATLVAIKNETGSWKQSLIMAPLQIVIAWIVSFLIFHIFRMF